MDKGNKVKIIDVGWKNRECPKCKTVGRSIREAKISILDYMNGNNYPQYRCSVCGCLWEETG
ncbi:MAG: hypothetical protein M0R80_02045 [Proteobacteria bacterium]|jgi:hypothetical protein|nr:hypothetical protein [Pseudomonadota bacterium]